MPWINLRSTGFTYKVTETEDGIFTLYDGDIICYRSRNLVDFVEACLCFSYSYRDFDTIECVKFRPEFRKEFNRQKNARLYS